MKPHPLLEAIPERGLGYSVQEISFRGDQAFTDPVARVIAVPLGNSVPESNLRAHELAHVAWSPLEGGKPAARRIRVPWRVLAAVEDGRVNLNCRRVGIDLDAGMCDEPMLREVLASVEAAGVVNGTLILVSVLGLKREAEALADVLRALPWGAQCIDAAREIEGVLTAAGPGFIPYERSVAAARRLHEILKRTTGGRRIKLQSGVRRRRTVLLPSWARRNIAGNVADPEAGRLWGEMTVETPPLTQTRSLKNGYRRIASTEGVEIVAAERLATDGQIFCRRARLSRTSAGSVLIDASGSMSLSDADLRAILEALPFSTVACYSADEASGVLRVLARDARRVASDLVCAPSGKGNIVDGPALRWLAKQPRPRYWISDGRVTGVGDLGDAALSREAARLLVTHGIARVGSIREIATLRQTRVRGCAAA